MNPQDTDAPIRSSRKKARADEDYEYEYDDMEALEGSPPSMSGAAGDTDELASTLLEMTAVTLKIAVYLTELDENEWRSVVGRLGAFLAMVDTLPRAPTKKAKRVGFQAPEPKKKPTKKPSKKGR